MFLRELEVDRFRAIRRARLRLDASTTLTGENGCGIGSLIAALQLVLGSSENTRVSAADVHRAGAAGASAGDVRVRLVFEERTAGEWRSDWHAPLGRHLPTETGKRHLVLEASQTLRSMAGPQSCGCACRASTTRPPIEPWYATSGR